MAWMNTLYRTYEANARMAGLPVEGVPLSLVAHMTANAQVEVWVDSSGKFLRCRHLGERRGKDHHPGNGRRPPPVQAETHPMRCVIPFLMLPEISDSTLPIKKQPISQT